MQHDYAQQYQLATHPGLAFAQPAPRPTARRLVLPSDLGDEKNTLPALIEADPVLQALFDGSAFVLELHGEAIALESQLLKTQRSLHTLVPGDRVRLHLRRDLLAQNCPEAVRNTVYLQMLRDTPVVYGDEQRTKQAHVFTYQLYADFLQPSLLCGDDFAQVDLSGIIDLHRAHYQRGVLNNLFVTTYFLREYHYQKQKANAFYHVQTANLPFQNFEFHFLP
ncbi:MAG: hypothetical protein R3E55_03770 [Burkholderiaceae bacterium]